MSRRRPHRPVDRAESDRLLDTPRAGEPAASTDPLAALLAAAAAPARPDELAGEEAALAGFRAARAAPAPVRAPRRRRFTARALAWAAGVLATATAGAAFAAVSLDGPPDPTPPPGPATPAPSTGRPDGSPTGGATPTGDPGASPTPAPSPGSSGPSAVPKRDGALAGHCRAYLAKNPAQRQKALETPGFAPLVAAAGGAGQVEAYCQRLVAQDGPGPTNGPGDGSAKENGSGNGNGNGDGSGNGNGNGSRTGNGNGNGSGSGNGADAENAAGTARTGKRVGAGDEPAEPVSPATDRPTPAAG
ncbi:hypothetical protein ABTX15_28990 [Micromonospora sp. NPDC094482]|uniref:hypothetical protein n=1 Tax=unclassified Micromonospora TaxID=2617518 RepID=UPI0033342DD7